MSTKNSLLPNHLAKLHKSAVCDKVILQRGYESTSTKTYLESLGFSRSQCNVPALVIPLYDANGRRAGTQIRPDKPRMDPKKARQVKYESPRSSKPIIDVPPGVREQVLTKDIPLYFTEGTIKADAAVSRGMVCVSVAGVWAWSAADPFWETAPLDGRRVYIVFDSDMATNAGVKKACNKIFNEFKKHGADPYVVNLPDANGVKQGLDDFLAAHNTIEDLLRLTSSTPPLLDKPETALEAGDSYRITPDGLVRVVTRIYKDEEKEDITPLTNFVARITADFEVRDGLDTRHELEITATLGGVDQVISVTPDEFEAMTWVLKKLGGNAIVHAGFTTRDHARAAIQSVSGEIPKKVVYEHLGWVWHNYRWLFLHAGGVIGTDPDGSLPVYPDQVAIPKSRSDKELSTSSPISPILAVPKGSEDLLVRVPNVLKDYRFPEPPSGDQLISAIRETLGIIQHVMPQHIALVMLSAVFRIAITGVDFGIHIVGRTNVGKTELMALFTQFFGAELHARNLPGSHMSTMNHNLAMAWYAMNVLYPVDDLTPATSQSDMERSNRDTDRLFRAMGNHAGRGRCSSGGTPREGKAPRCLLGSTGEIMLEGHSLNSRVITLELNSGDVLPDDTALLNDLERRIVENQSKLLEYAKRAARSGRSAGVMAAYLRWMAPRYDQVVVQVAEQKTCFREVFQAPGRLARSADIAADLLAGFEIFLEFCRESGALDDLAFDGYWLAVHEALHKVLGKQQTDAEEREPVKQFLSLLATAFTTGRGHLKNRCPLDNSVPDETPDIWGWEQRERTVNGTDADGKPTSEEKSFYCPRGDHIGWVSGCDIYIEIEAALAVVQRLAKESGLRPLALTKYTLGKALAAMKLLRTSSKDHYTSKVSIMGIQKRVLHMSSDAVFEYFRDSGPDQASLEDLLDS